MTEYKVQLDTYSGPLDLLLYLIRRDEIDVADIPIARVTQQYLEYMDLLKELNVDLAGEFLIMAATLMEIKSRMMLPAPPQTDDEEMEDPRLELVRQLMEYKRFKEAAMTLGEQAHERARRFGRPGEGPRLEERQAPESGLTEVGLWALVEAFSRVMKQTGRAGPHVVTYDDTPMEIWMERLVARVQQESPIPFLRLFAPDAGRAALIGMFLALLELILLQRVRADQEEAFGEIRIVYLGEGIQPGQPSTEIPDAARSQERAPDAPGHEEPAAASADEGTSDDTALDPKTTQND